MAARPALRRLETGWGAVVAGEAISQVAISVLAYRVGGIGGLGSLVALQVLPSALFAAGRRAARARRGVTSAAVRPGPLIARCRCVP